MREKKASKWVSQALDISRGRAKYATIRDRITDGVRIDGIHLCQLIAAMIIASIGLNTDSTEAVIGAMLICPIMGSVLAISYAIATMDMRLLRRAALAFAIEVGICLVTSTFYFAVSPLHTVTSSLLNNSSATVWDLLIALTGGFAGALGMSRRQEPKTLISGVAVATALMPPLCAVGYGIAARSGLSALFALYEFLINVVFIGFGSSLVFLWLRIPFVGDLDGDGREDEGERAEAERESFLLRHRIALALVVFAIPCWYFSLQVINRQAGVESPQAETVDTYDTETVIRELEVLCPGFVSYTVQLADSASADEEIVRRVVATVESTSELSAIRQNEIEALIRVHVADLDEVEFVVTQEASEDGSASL